MSCQEAFWKWFVAHEDELLNLEADRERVFDSLHEQLNRVHPDLVFEFGPRAARREFVISAGGLRDVFPAVSALVASAPKLDRWRITGFRPRRTPLNRIEIGEVCIDPADVEFSLLTNGSMVGLRLYIPEFHEKNKAMKQIAYLMLDEALGEYDVETKIGLIQMVAKGSTASGERHPLTMLPEVFDSVASKLSRAGAPN
jgi:hypothetical protein